MKIKLILLIPIFILLTGCWDYNELNKMAIVTGMAIDKADNEIEVSILISNAKKASSINSDEASTVIYVGKGSTMTDALKDIAVSSPKKLYLGHLSAIIVSDLVAYDGISTITDYLLRELEMVKSFYLVLAKESKAKEVLSSISPLESFPSQTIYKSITTSSEAQGFSLAVSFTDFTSNMLKTGKNAILPSVTIIKNEIASDEDEKTSLKIDNIGIFKGDKLKGYVSNEASRGISILENSVNQLSTTISCNGGKVSLNISSLKSTKHIKDNDLIINISGSSYLKDVSCNLDLNDVDAINKLENDIENDLKKVVLTAIKETQSYHSDIFGVGNMIYKKNPKYFNSIKNSWNDKLYPKLNVKINVSIKLISNGSINIPIKEAINEK